MSSEAFGLTRGQHLGSIHLKVQTALTKRDPAALGRVNERLARWCAQAPARPSDPAQAAPWLADLTKLLEQKLGPDEVAELVSMIKQLAEAGSLDVGPASSGDAVHSAALRSMRVCPDGRVVLGASPPASGGDSVSALQANKLRAALQLAAGRNVTERAMSFVRAQPGFANATHESVHERACQLVRSLRGVL